MFPIFLAACSSDGDEIFDENSTMRLRAVLDNCAEAVLQPEHGWKMLYAPDLSKYGGYNVLMKFETDGEVRMYTDFLDEESVSSYSFNGSQGPVLSFDTQSCLHYLADPSQVPVGTGHKGEFEFVIQDITADSLVFTGKKYGQRIVFYPAEEEDWTTRMEAYRSNIEMLVPYNNAPYFRGLTLNQTAVNLSYFPDSRTVSYTYCDEATKEVHVGQVGVFGTENGVKFMPKIKVNGVVLDELKYNQKLGVFEAGTPGVVGVLTYSHKPPFPFYGSVQMLKNGSNIASLPKFADFSGGLSNVAEILNAVVSLVNLSSLMSEELSNSYPSLLIAGMKQFRLSWSLEYEGEAVGPWFSLFGGKTLLEAADQTADFRLSMEMLREEGDQIKFKDAFDIRRHPDSEDATFQTNMLNTDGFTTFFNFITDPAGFTVVPESGRIYTLVNLADSRRWIRLTKE
ncbi:DUF4302 domain-containing protein [Alistipes sp. OttesenSCG-928-B03]|nr:DUF4302 domain-containing protein [Alistipes sp. OttesenSCG-928-B03]